MCQKRPTYVVKELYICGKRDLHMCQKRPTYVAKETYIWRSRVDLGVDFGNSTRKNTPQKFTRKLEKFTFHTSPGGTGYILLAFMVYMLEGVGDKSYALRGLLMPLGLPCIDT